jgi:hypothetical protein
MCCNGVAKASAVRSMCEGMVRGCTALNDFPPICQDNGTRLLSAREAKRLAPDVRSSPLRFSYTTPLGWPYGIFLQRISGAPYPHVINASP